MNRIEATFRRLGERGEKGLVFYIGAGDPDLDSTRRLALAFDRAGVDILEIGVPFSDPLADGLVNQLAAQRGLESGTTPAGVLETVGAIRRESGIPIVLYIYFNLVHRHGMREFIGAAARAGVDGLLVLDLPPEEAGRYEEWMGEEGLCNVYLVAPTTPEERLKQIVTRGRGFIYYVSREGVTGMQDRLASDLGARMEAIRRHTSLPVAIGFGVSNPDQARQVAAFAEAVVVGSAVVNEIHRWGKDATLVHRLEALARAFSGAVRGSREGRAAEPGIAER